MPIILLDLFGTSNLGIFGFATDKYAVVRKDIGENVKAKLSEVLKVEVVLTDIGQSFLVGVLATGNSNGIILPEFATETEIKILKEKLDVEVGVVPGLLTCLGNNVLCNDKCSIIHPDFTKEAEKVIEDTLKVEVIRGRIGAQPIVGSLGVATNKGAIVSPDISEEQLKTYQEALKVPVNTGTTNSGNYYVKSGLIANSNGAIAGGKTTGPELIRIEEILNLQ